MKHVSTLTVAVISALFFSTIGQCAPPEGGAAAAPSGGAATGLTDPTSNTTASTADAGKGAAPPGAAAAMDPKTIIVLGTRLRACRLGDQSCIHEVSRTIWKLYPEQMKDRCAAIAMRRTKQDIVASAVGIDGTDMEHSVPAAFRTVCEDGDAWR